MARLASPSPRPELRHRGQAPAATGGPQPSPTNPFSLHPGLGELSRCPSSKGQREMQTWPRPPGPALPFPTSLPSGPRPSPAPLPASLLTVSPRFLPSLRRPRSPLDLHPPSGLPLTAPHPAPDFLAHPAVPAPALLKPRGPPGPPTPLLPQTRPIPGSRGPSVPALFSRISFCFELQACALSGRFLFIVTVICLNCTGHTGTRVWGPWEHEAASQVQSRLASPAPPQGGEAPRPFSMRTCACVRTR